MADDTLVATTHEFRPMELPEAYRSLCEWLLPPEDARDVWRGSGPPRNGYSPVRHLLDAGIIRPDGLANLVGEVFFCLWVSRPRDDDTSVHFVFEGVSDADVSAVVAVELQIGERTFESPATRLPDNQIKAVWVTPINALVDGGRQTVNGPIRVRLVTRG